MADKPVFDSKEGDELLRKMKEGIETLSQLKKNAMSSDPEVRKKANEEMREHILRAQELIEKIKSGKLVDIQKLKELFSNPDNFSAEQKEMYNNLERMTRALFSEELGVKNSEKKESSEPKKKGGSKNKWMKS